MRISHAQVRNFRNFADLDVVLGEHSVIVNENRVGKPNLLYASCRNVPGAEPYTTFEAKSGSKPYLK